MGSAKEGGMKIFISWSGERSHTVARALEGWLRAVNPVFDPWLSTRDIDIGERWMRKLESGLAESGAGVLCVTRENQAAPWILFEAGALSNRQLPVMPYLIHMRTAEVQQGPLPLLAMGSADRQGSWLVVRALNRALGEAALDEADLGQTFEEHWPALEQVLYTLPPSAEKPRSAEEMVPDILELVRELAARRGGLVEDDMVVLSRMLEKSSGKSFFTEFLDWTKRRSPRVPVDEEIQAFRKALLKPRLDPDGSGTEGPE
jgi:hypothetical protein